MSDSDTITRILESSSSSSSSTEAFVLLSPPFSTTLKHFRPSPPSAGTKRTILYDKSSIDRTTIKKNEGNNGRRMNRIDTADGRGRRCDEYPSAQSSIKNEDLETPRHLGYVSPDKSRHRRKHQYRYTIESTPIHDRSEVGLSEIDPRWFPKDINASFHEPQYFEESHKLLQKDLEFKELSESRMTSSSLRDSICSLRRSLQSSVVAADLEAELDRVVGLLEKMPALEVRLREETQRCSAVRAELDEERQTSTTLRRQLAEEKDNNRRMRAYVGDTKPANVSSPEDSNVSRTQIESLRRQNELLNIRMAAMEELTALQDKRAGTSIYKNSSQPLKNNNIDGALLLKRWRDKVYSMLVERRLTSAQHTRDHVAAERKFTSAIERAENAEHSLEEALMQSRERAATTAIEIEARRTAEEECEQIRSTNEALRTRVDEQEKSLAKLFELIRSAASNTSNSFSNIQGPLGKVAALEQRLAFACSRLGTLKTLFDQRVRTLLVRIDELECERSSWMYYEDTVKLSSTSTLLDDQTFLLTEKKEISAARKIETSDTLMQQRKQQQHLLRELHRLTAERDHLILLRSGDADRAAAKISAVESHYKSEINKWTEVEKKLQDDVRNAKKESSVTLEETSSTIATLRQQLTLCQDSLRHAEEALHRSTVETNMQKITAERSCRDAVLEEQRRSAEELADIHSQFNAASREVTTTRASVQHLERQIEVLRTRHADEIIHMKERNEASIAKLERKLEISSKERNTLLAIISASNDGNKVLTKTKAPIIKTPKPDENGIEISGASLKQMRALAADLLDDTHDV